MCGLVFIGDKDISKEKVQTSLDKIKHRGPDDQKILTTSKGHFAFTRLSIMDLSNSGNQPFDSDKSTVICNGEIYNFRSLKGRYKFDYTSDSDCEVLAPVYDKEKENIVNVISGEFAFVLWDKENDSLFAARDPMGIRPMFFGHTKAGKVCFASEAKALMDICDDVEPFPIGHYYRDGEFVKYIDLS